MKRALASVLVVVLAVACRDHGPPDLPAGPLAAISDGAHTGNPDFFFLPPMVPNPSGDANFEPAQFNAALSPTVQVCAWNGTACGAIVAEFTMSSGLGSEIIRVNPTDGQYNVNWHTDLSRLDPAFTYRVLVWVGNAGHVLGYADVDVVNSGKELKSVVTQEFIPLLNGRTLPIKFRIENGALCSIPGADDCASETIDLAEGGSVVILQTGDRIDIPPQASGEEVTLTIEYCDGIDVDLRKFGPCLHVTAEPALTEDLFPRAVVSLCSEPPTGLTEEQEDLVTLHRQDGEVITALPHARDLCAPVIGSRATGVRGLLLAGWNAITTVLAPRPLQASLALIDAGVGGETEGFSDFQFALPALMTPLEGTDGQTAAPGSAVPIPPGVRLIDWHEETVAGATVHFEELVDTDNDGLGDTWESRGSVDANTDGVAQLDSWVLASPGVHQMRATGRGIADPADEHPFMPDIDQPTAEQEPVVVGTGEVLFNATATAPTGLLLRYQFDGNADNTGLLAGFNGTATSVTFPEGKFGSAIKFDGTSGTGATMPGTSAVFASGSKWTISLWFREDAPQKNETLLWRFRGSGQGWETYHGVNEGEPGALQRIVTCSNGGCFSFSPGTGVWHNIVYRYDAPSETVGAPVQIYVDGALAGALENIDAIPLVGSDVSDIRLGRFVGLLGPALFYVDEFRVYNQVFSAADQCTIVTGGTWNGEGCTLP